MSIQMLTLIIITDYLIRREITSRNKQYKKWEIQPDFVIEGLNELLYL